MSWTDERIDTLKTMWEAGQTASQIAEALGGVSRNAVIGKAHRLGLQSRPSPVVSKEEARVQAAAAAAQDAAPVVEAPTPHVEEAPAETVVIPAPEPVVAPAPREEVAPEPVAEQIEEDDEDEEAVVAAAPAPRERPVESQQPILRSVGPGGFVRQAPGEQQAPSTPAPPRRLVPARTAPEYADKTSLLDLSDKVCKWPLGHPGEPDFHFCGEKVNPGFPYCVTHCGHAYQAQLPRRDRRAAPLPFGGPRMR
ncbi:GcrA cell cycle regulator [Sphingomonas sp. RHCKR47]|uniref:GcrA family cell cycle regulator n=1 Tax=Sphingomonas citricola TaxID=2862498 RepID=UPI001CA4C3FD|nr:GcrA family cell cycle regulator [Sphingomonas citricola]MBW6523147.1 GcrA cell cycle regulator [Sphingomonas citricola]